MVYLSYLKSKVRYNLIIISKTINSSSDFLTKQKFYAE